MTDIPPPPPPAPEGGSGDRSTHSLQRPWLWPAIAVAAMLVAAVAVTALAVGGDDPAPQSAAAPTTTAPPAGQTSVPAAATAVTVTIAPTTAVPPTTAAASNTAPAEVPVAAAAFNAQESIKELAQSHGAKEYSKPWEGPCGTFAMLVLNDHIELYLWSGERWDDASLLLGDDGAIDPLTVTSRDYTGDGATDFLVTYDGAGATGGHDFGGVFAVFDCTWGWVDILTQDGEVTQVLDAMYFDDATGQIYGQDFVEGVGRATVMLIYDRHSNFFATEYNG